MHNKKEEGKGNMKKRLLLLTMILAVTAHASLRFFNSSGVQLGNKTDFKCGTNLTCSVVSGKVEASVSSLSGSLTLANDEVIANSTDDVIRLSSNDASMVVDVYSPLTSNGDATLRFSADASADNGDDWEIQHDGATNNLVFQNDTSGSQVAKLTVSTAGAVSVVGDLSGDGGDQLYGFLNNQVAATATTITASQCGSSFINSGAVEMELPEASTVLGCQLRFIVGNASNFDIDPDAADQILFLTNAPGDILRGATLGTSVSIEAISASQWAVTNVVSEAAWSDQN